MRAIRPGALATTAAAAALVLGACSLDLQNPNAPTEVQATTSAEGIIALATGLQGRFATSYAAFAYMAGLVTDEFAAGTSALISISDAEQGAVAPNTGVADAVFNSIYRTVRSADEVLAGADALGGQFDAGTRSGLRALAFALKGESLGEALQSYQRIPIRTYDVVAPEYVARSVALPYVRELLDSANAQLTAAPPSTFFNTNIVTPGLNLPNTVQLLRARYARMANDHAGALAAANLVQRSGPAALSVLTFPAPAVNPYANVSASNIAILPRRSWRLSMLPEDQRWRYFVSPDTLRGRVGAPLDNFGRYADPRAPLPVYLPDEALLIKAEALANLGQLAAAQAALDSVRTDCTGGRGLDDPKACLPALGGQLSQADLLAEVYTQRRYELFGTGLRWEDVRRRSAIRGPVAAPAVPFEGQRCWLPYSNGDRNANPNALREVLPDPTEPTGFPAGCPTQ